MAVIVFRGILLIRLLLIPLILQPCLLVLLVQLSIDVVDELEAGGLGGLTELLACRADGRKTAVEAEAVEQIDDQKIE